MIRKEKMMRRTFIILLSVFFPLLATAQSFRERRQADRERWYAEKEKAEKGHPQEAKALPDSVYHEAAVQLLRNRRFVLEADQVVFKHGRSTFVNPSTNFISLSADQAVIQISPLEGAGGLNGTGGITLEGNASNIQITEDGKRNIRMSMNVMGRVVTAQVEIRLAQGSNRASVTVSSLFSSHRTELNGRIVPYELSSFFKGISM